MRRTACRPKKSRTTWTWCGNSSSSTTVAMYPANGPSPHTRTCCPFRGKGAASRCSSMSSPSSTLRQVSDRAPSHALHLPLSIYNGMGRHRITRLLPIIRVDGLAQPRKPGRNIPAAVTPMPHFIFLRQKTPPFRAGDEWRSRSPCAPRPAYRRACGNLRLWSGADHQGPTERVSRSQRFACGRACLVRGVQPRNPLPLGRGRGQDLQHEGYYDEYPLTEQWARAGMQAAPCATRSAPRPPQWAGEGRGGGVSLGVTGQVRVYSATQATPHGVAAGPRSAAPALPVARFSGTMPLAGSTA